MNQIFFLILKLKHSNLQHFCSLTNRGMTFSPPSLKSLDQHSRSEAPHCVRCNGWCTHCWLSFLRYNSALRSALCPTGTGTGSQESACEKYDKWWSNSFLKDKSCCLNAQFSRYASRFVKVLFISEAEFMTINHNIHVCFNELCKFG